MGQATTRWYTLANLITGIRAALALPVAAGLLFGHPALALAVFAVAVATDLLDGVIARRRGESTAIGGLLDHGTDAGFVTLVLAAAAWLGMTPWLLPALIPLAFLQYTLDSRALAGRPLRASRLGRWNGIAYYVLAGGVLMTALIAGTSGSDRSAVQDGLATGIAVAGWLLAATTVASMADRAVAFWRGRAGAIPRA